MAASSSIVTGSAFLGCKLGAPAPSSLTLVSPGNMRSRGNVVAMAKTKSGRVLIRMISSAGTGTFYVTSKNPRNTPNKLELLKYDKVLRKRVLFQEAKIKSGSGK